MTALIFYIAIALSAIPSSKCGALFGDNTEISYSYRATVSTNSQWSKSDDDRTLTSLEAHLTLRTSGNFVSAIFTNATYSINAVDDNIENDRVPIDSLSKEFVVEYDVAGKAIGIHVAEDDSRFSVDFKKAIASLLQLSQVDWANLKTKPFYVDEQSVYGECAFLYRIKPNRTTVITKSLSPSKCVGYIGEHRVTTLVERAYHIKDGVVERIESANTIVATQPNVVYKIDQYLVRQSTVDNSATTIDVADMKHRKLKVDLRYETDFRPKRGFEETQQKVLKRLKNMMMHPPRDRSFDRYQFDANADSVYPLIELMRFLNATELAKIYADAKAHWADDEMASLFLHVSSLIGTREWIVFFSEELLNGRVREYDAIGAIEQIPFNVKRPDAECVKVLLRVLDANGVDSQIKPTLTLTIASVASKALTLTPNSREIVNDVVDRFIDAFKDENNNRVLYMGALSNIRAPRVAKFLETVIGSEQYSPKVRSMAISALGVNNAVAAIQSSWPIIERRSDPLEMRFAALNVLLSTKSDDHLTKLNVIMNEETNAQLISAYRRLLESAAALNSPSSFSEAAGKLLRMFHAAPSKGRDAFAYVFDHFDVDFKATLIGDIFADNFTTLRVDVDRESYDFNFAFTDEERKRRLAKRRAYDELYEAFVRGTIRAQMIRSEGGRVVSIESDALAAYVNRANRLRARSHRYAASQRVDESSFVANELGAPMAAFANDASTSRTMYRMYIEGDKREHGPLFAYEHHGVVHGVRGLKLYQPMAGAWIGRRSNRLVETRAPLNVSIEMHSGTTYVVFTHDRMDVDAYFKSLGYDEHFVEPINERVQAACPSCDSSSVYIPRGYDTQEHIVWKRSPLTDTSFYINTMGFDGGAFLKDLKSDIFKGDAVDTLIRIPMYLKSVFSRTTIMRDEQNEPWGLEMKLRPHHTASRTAIILPPLIPRCDGESDVRKCFTFNVTLDTNFVYEEPDYKSWRFRLQYSDLYQLKVNTTASFVHRQVGGEWSSCYEGVTTWNGDLCDSKFVYGHNDTGVEVDCGTDVDVEIHIRGEPYEGVEDAYENCTENGLRCMDALVNAKRYAYNLTAHSNVAKTYETEAFLAFSKYASTYELRDPAAAASLDALEIDFIYSPLTMDTFDVKATSGIGVATFVGIPVDYWRTPLYLAIPNSLTHSAAMLRGQRKTCTVGADKYRNVVEETIELDPNDDAWKLALLFYSYRGFQTKLYTKRIAPERIVRVWDIPE